jgi:polyvinyl alcohol dehydrogenase (cytochrome)
MSRILLQMVVAVGLSLTSLAGTTQTLDFSTVGEEAGEDEGARLFSESCAICHNSAQSGRTPSKFSLSGLTTRAIVASLQDGVMRSEGAELSHDQRVLVAESLTGGTYDSGGLPESAYCLNRGFAPVDTSAVLWMGYGGNLAATGFQSAELAGLTAADVPDLELRWAFAFPNATQSRTKPTIVGDVALVGDQYGSVYAIEVDSGCVRWTFAADSGIRGAILVGDDPDGRALAWFVDFRTTVYALDITNGTVLWKKRAGRHVEASNTGSPALHNGRLFVPISTMEVVVALDPTYECCTASGAVAALDAGTGELVWYHRVITEDPVQTGKNSAGARLFAPSGAPVWSSPTIDVERGLVYVGTGENFTRPATSTSDSILAIDIDTGKLAWSFQALADDAWTMACGREYDANCPEANGPDLDFGMAPILVTREDGKEMLVVGQKSGVVWALDPDDKGEVLWSTRVGKGGALGGIHWGMATDGRRVFAPVADRGDSVIVDVNPDRPVSPGLYALDLKTGKQIWSTPAPTDTCLGKQGCFASMSAAPAAIPGAVFTGGLDGYVRAHSSDDGSLLWEYDTTGDFETVNGIAGHGGAIDGPAPVIAGGLVFVNSGYGMFGQMPGNVLLAFGVEKE